MNWRKIKFYLIMSIVFITAIVHVSIVYRMSQEIMLLMLCSLGWGVLLATMMMFPSMVVGSPKMFFDCAEKFPKHTIDNMIGEIIEMERPKERE